MKKRLSEKPVWGRPPPVSCVELSGCASSWLLRCGRDRHEKQEMQVARARVSPTGKITCHSNLSSFGRRAKHARCGLARSRHICFSHVLVAVRQPRPAPQRFRNRRRTTRQKFSGAEKIYPASPVQWQVSSRGDELSTSSKRWL
jgi:hypothetical protein